MKALKKIIFLLPAVFLMSCEKDDDLQEPDTKQEVITTVEMVFHSQNGLDDEFLVYRELNGEDPEIILPALSTSTTYGVQIHFLDENPVPMDSINNRIISKGDEYQVFISFNPPIGISHSYTDADMHGKPVGLGFQIVTDSAGVTNMNLQLRSKPDKEAVGVTNGDTANAGGEILKEIEVELSIE